MWRAPCVASRDLTILKVADDERPKIGKLDPAVLGPCCGVVFEIHDEGCISSQGLNSRPASVGCDRNGLPHEGQKGAAPRPTHL
jgi:hypothetical protein